MNNILNNELSLETKLERYQLLLRSRACTPFWKGWIQNKINQLKESI